MNKIILYLGFPKQWISIIVSLVHIIKQLDFEPGFFVHNRTILQNVIFFDPHNALRRFQVLYKPL